jgi:hypothetical protein
MLCPRCFGKWVLKVIGQPDKIFCFGCKIV